MFYAQVCRHCGNEEALIQRQLAASPQEQHNPFQKTILNVLTVCSEKTGNIKLCKRENDVSETNELTVSTLGKRPREDLRGPLPRTATSDSLCGDGGDTCKTADTGGSSGVLHSVIDTYSLLLSVSNGPIQNTTLLVSQTAGLKLTWNCL